MNQEQPSRSRELLRDGDVAIDVLVDGEGPAIVMLPSSQRDSMNFDEVAKRIATAGFRVLRPQPRGMARSSGPMEGLDLNVLARDVALTVDRLGGGRAVLVGHAYGHFVARVADMNHRAQVCGVVVLGAAAKVFPPGLVESLDIASDPQKPQAERLEQLQFSPATPRSPAARRVAGIEPRRRVGVHAGRPAASTLSVQRPTGFSAAPSDRRHAARAPTRCGRTPR
jgi:pimeloyl-ACP methyl ester carboxylesterase